MNLCHITLLPRGFHLAPPKPAIFSHLQDFEISVAFEIQNWTMRYKQGKEEIDTVNDAKILV